MHAADFLAGIDPKQLEELYEQYRKDPYSLDSSWALVFAGYELGLEPGKRSVPDQHAGDVPEQISSHYEGGGQGRTLTTGVNILVHAYRSKGHLIAELDPLGDNLKEHPLLQIEEFGFTEEDGALPIHGGGFRGLERTTLDELLAALRETYCSTMGVQYLNISDKAKRDWLLEKMEPVRNRPKLDDAGRKWIYQELVKAEGFEKFLHAKFRGQKRFSLEGGESLIPLMKEILEVASADDVKEIVIGMPHRGRLNVLANIMGKPYEMMLGEFDGGLLPAGVEGAGDVKYHKGYSSDYTSTDGKQVHLSLSHNPSHLEAIYPVVEGMVRAKQSYMGDTERKQVLPLVLHGDAAFAGQGIVFETLQTCGLPGYSTGGTVHIIVNNQVGFTTSPNESRPTRYASDLAKVIAAPVFHVNGDDPEAVVQAARLAFEYRQTFGEDVLIDLICYRRHGHNELDDPTFTQPELYEKIAAHETVLTLYGKKLAESGALAAEEQAQLKAEFRAVLDEALDTARNDPTQVKVQAYAGRWEGIVKKDDAVVDTQVDAQTLVDILHKNAAFPAEFSPHTRLPKMFKQMAEDLAAGKPVPWAAGETLAYGSLLLEGTDIRITGQDVGRGTFTHRHAQLSDTTNNEHYVPLNHLESGQGFLEIHNSPLNENGVLGFEYGYASADPKTLVIWEAQFGDFANGAQVIIDQFIASGESKWHRSNGLTLLLPHGYEGQGPEHSSARLERFLQLCAFDNMQVVYPTTPAQIFHLLRRQVRSRVRKPLVVMSPKSLLRLRAAQSTLKEFSEGSFQALLRDPDAPKRAETSRVIFCSGKVYYSLLEAREEQGRTDIAIHRVEQLYPFPREEVRAAMKGVPKDADVLWVQEEHWNMGAWSYVSDVFKWLLPAYKVHYVGRAESASPAAGDYKTHLQEEQEFINDAMRKIGVKGSRYRAG